MDQEPNRPLGVHSDLDLPPDMSPEEEAWLSCCRHMGAAARAAIAPLVGTVAGRQILGRGSGGDETVELDEVAERVMIEVARERAPGVFRIVSEEQGASGDESAPWTVLIDPVDGSLNAKRGIPLFSAVVAVADGPAIEDVRVGYVVDLVSSAEYAVVAGKGVAVTRRVEPADDGPEVEAVMLEAGSPDRQEFVFADLTSLACGPWKTGVRVRQLGSLALSLCQVAVGAADVLVSPVPSRAVDIAAGVALVRQTGGGAAALDGADICKQPLDLARRSPFVAWRAGVNGARMAERTRRIFGISG